MCNAFLDEVFGLERGLERSHIDPWVHLEQVNFSQSDFTTDFTGAHVKVREPRTDYFLFIVFVFDGVGYFALPGLVAVWNLLDQVDVVLNSVHLVALLHVDVLHILGGVEFTLMLMNHL